MLKNGKVISLISLLIIISIIFIIGIISGILPALAVGLMNKYPLLIIPVLIVNFIWIMKELCYEGD